MWKYRIGDPVTHIEHPENKGVIYETKTLGEVTGDGGSDPWYSIMWVVSHTDEPWTGNESEGSIKILTSSLHDCKMNPLYERTSLC